MISTPVSEPLGLFVIKICGTYITINRCILCALFLFILKINYSTFMDLHNNIDKLHYNNATGFLYNIIPRSVTAHCRISWCLRL